MRLAVASARTQEAFSPEDFHALHPGGKLGQILLRVGNLMHVGEEVAADRRSTARHAAGAAGS